jgi:methylenetetrahydrofolate reductase (NADPH)
MGDRGDHEGRAATDSTATEPGAAPGLRACIEQLYLEIFPVEGIEEELANLPEGSRIGITCSPRRGLRATLDLVGHLRASRFQVVPHVAARQVRDASHLRDIVQQLDEQGVRGLFVPGGDIPEPVGDFDSSLSLLRSLAEAGHGFEHIGVAAYPEGHPDIDEQTLFTALLEKQEIATYMVTQMCFDAKVSAGWLRSMRARGIHLPAWIGLPGVMNRMKLFRTSLRIGVGESARFARRQTRLAGELLRSSVYTPDQLVLELEPQLVDPSCNIGGFYLFSFNQVRDTIAWREGLLNKLR